MNTTNKDTITQILQEILAENPNFFCFTDHRQLKILSWNSQTIPSVKVLKIGDQRFIGFPKKDRYGKDYWKYQPCRENIAGTPANLETDSIAKFQQRQEQTKDYEPTNNSEQSINQQSQPNS